MIMNDIEIIRAVRVLCIKHEFDQAIRLANKVQDDESRKTLTFICESFRNSQISLRTAK